MWVKLLEFISLIFFLTFVILFFVMTSQTKSDWENKTEHLGEDYKTVLIQYPNNLKILNGNKDTIKLPISLTKSLTCKINKSDIKSVKNNEKFYTGIVFYKSCEDLKIFVQE